MHVSLPVGSGVLMGERQLLGPSVPPPVEGSNFALSIEGESREHCDEIFAKLSEGRARSRCRCRETFWGAYFGNWDGSVRHRLDDQLRVAARLESSIGPEVHSWAKFAKRFPGRDVRGRDPRETLVFLPVRRARASNGGRWLQAGLVGVSASPREAWEGGPRLRPLPCESARVDVSRRLTGRRSYRFTARDPEVVAPMHGSPTITRIELTAFEITVPGVGTDRGGLGVRYAPPAPGSPRWRFAVRILTNEGGERRVHPAPGTGEGSRWRPARRLAIGSSVPPLSSASVTTGPCGAQRCTSASSGSGPLDVALWDLAGKHQGVSVGTMLGGWRVRLPAYASTPRRRPPGTAVSRVRRRTRTSRSNGLEMGYPAYKMHGWNAGDREEEKRYDPRRRAAGSAAGWR